MTRRSRILNIYAYCGTTVAIESMASNARDVILQGNGITNQSGKGKDDINAPQNYLTTADKRDFVIVMAKSLADLYDFPGGRSYIQTSTLSSG